MFLPHDSPAGLDSQPLRRRVWRDELRMLRLEPLELVHHLVEVGIRNFRGIEHVIAILVVPDFLAQSFDFFLDVGTGHDWGIIEVLSSGSQLSVKPVPCRFHSAGWRPWLDRRFY